MNTTVVLNFATLIVNCATMYFIFPVRRSYLFSFCILALCTAVVVVIIRVMGDEMSGLRGLLFLPVMLALFRGQIFQITFAFFLQYFITALIISLTSAIIAVFVPVGTEIYEIAGLIVTLMLYAGYITVLFAFGRRLIKKLFVDGRRGEWALYALGSAFSFAVLMALRSALETGVLYIALLLFMMWSFVMLCFAIINTHEKTRKNAEAEFAESVISSGRGHYQKMDEMYDRLRILRHDFKYHLTAVGELLSSGDKEEVDMYLSEVQARLSENEMCSYCTNNVINALLSNYAERCANAGVRFEADVSLPETLTVPNYDLSIVLGNLLENAIEACEKAAGDKMIELRVKPLMTQLAVRVRNSFDGKPVTDGGRLISAKKDGGFGLRSVEAVAARYDGELATEWDGGLFSAYVTVKL